PAVLSLESFDHVVVHSVVRDLALSDSELGNLRLKGSPLDLPGSAILLGSLQHVIGLPLLAVELLPQPVKLVSTRSLDPLLQLVDPPGQMFPFGSGSRLRFFHAGQFVKEQTDRFLTARQLGLEPLDIAPSCFEALLGVRRRGLVSIFAYIIRNRRQLFL